MSYRETTAAGLAEMMISAIGREVGYSPVPTDGAQKAAEIIAGLPEAAAQGGNRLTVF